MQSFYIAVGEVKYGVVVMHNGAMRFRQCPNEHDFPARWDKETTRVTIYKLVCGHVVKNYSRYGFSPAFKHKLCHACRDNHEFQQVMAMLPEAYKAAKYAAAVEQRRGWELLLRARHHVKHDTAAVEVLDQLYDVCTSKV